MRCAVRWTSRAVLTNAGLALASARSAVPLLGCPPPLCVLGAPVASGATRLATDGGIKGRNSVVQRSTRYAAASRTFNWKAIAEKLLNGLQALNQTRYGQVRLDDVLRGMEASQKVLDTVPSVRAAFHDAFFAIGVPLRHDDWTALHASPTEALLLETSPVPSLNIFTYKTYTTDDSFWEPSRSQASGLQVRFLDAAAHDTHTKRETSVQTSGSPLTYDMDVAKTIANVDLKRVIILHGESGSGKTLTAMLSAREHPTRDHGALCVCVVPTDLGRKDVILGSADSLKNDDLFNEDDPAKIEQMLPVEFEHALKKKWDCFVEKNPLLTDVAQEGHVTILFDEFGSYSDMIRAICTTQAKLVNITRAQLRLDAAVTVQIIVAGTGAHTGAHAIGSVPDAYHLQTVAPKLWLKSRLTTPAFAKAVCDAVEARESRAADYAWRMVTTNARACAIFLVQVSDMGKSRKETLVSPKLLRDLVVKTAAIFKSLNSLCSLSESRYRQLYLRAVALSLYAPDEDPGKDQSIDVAACFKCYGMVTDRAVLVKLSEPIGTTILQFPKRDQALCLPDECYGQRFYLSHAQIVIAQTVLGLNDGEHSSEGFGGLVADYFVHALMLAPWLQGKKLLQPLPPNPVTPAPWVHTLHLLSEVVKSASDSKLVMRARLKNKMEEPTDEEGGHHCIGDPALIQRATEEDVDAVLINADTSSCADLVVMQGKRLLWLVQTKRYESTTLSAEATEEQVVKIGAFKSEKVTKTITGSDRDVKQVIFVSGISPEGLTWTPRGTLLVHAWDPPSDNVLLKSPSLGGLYPFSHRDADFGVLKLPIDHPASQPN